jgi:hypothetical protein
MKLQVTALILTGVAWHGFGQSRPETVDIYLNDRDDSVRLLISGTPMASGRSRLEQTSALWGRVGKRYATRPDLPDQWAVRR